MKIKQSLTIAILLFLASATQLVIADLASVFAAPVATAAVKGCGERAWEYMYPTEKGKRIILKYFPYDKHRFHPVAQNCNENYTENCALLAQHLEKMEKYHEKRDTIRCLDYQIAMLQKEGKFDTTNLEQKRNALKAAYIKNTVHLSYFASLTPEEQDKILSLEIDLVREHLHPEAHSQELENLHAVLNN